MRIKVAVHQSTVTDTTATNEGKVTFSVCCWIWVYFERSVKGCMHLPCVLFPDVKPERRDMPIAPGCSANSTRIQL